MRPRLKGDDLCPLSIKVRRHYTLLVRITKITQWARVNLRHWFPRMNGWCQAAAGRTAGADLHHGLWLEGSNKEQQSRSQEEVSGPSANTYGTCRAPWPPERLAPDRWDRSCSICPWVCRLRCRSLRSAAEVSAAAAERGARAAPRAAPCSNRTATTLEQDWTKDALKLVVSRCGMRIPHGFVSGSTRGSCRTGLRMRDRRDWRTAVVICCWRVLLLSIGWCAHVF